MPHQRGEHPMSFGGSGAGGPGQPHRESDFQGRRGMGPRMVHHPSPGGQSSVHHHPRHVLYGGPHPHSPGWYENAAGSPHRPPHRVPAGSAMSVATASSGEHESAMEEQQHQHVVMKKEETAVSVNRRSEELKNKASIIQEAIRRHMDDDYSIGTNEADAASALLFATSAMRRESNAGKVSVTGSKADVQAEAGEVKGTEKKQSDVSEPQQAEEEDEEEKEEREIMESSIPLKKRRKLLDFLRKKPVTTATAEKKPLHVSPLPSPQVRNRVAAGNESSAGDTLASSSPPRTTASSSTCIENSYDMKDAQSLHQEEEIINGAVEISPPPSQVVIEHFPSVLHHLLTNSEFSGSVLQWLPDGKTWKILRWDALRRKVLPKFFSQIQDEDGKIACTIDTFLWHLAAWGFEEVQSGPDVGSYTHELFRKDSVQLCIKMNFEPKHNDLDSPAATKETNSNDMARKLHEASRPHSILQVPSLASRTGSEGEGTPKLGEKNMKWREEDRQHAAVHSPAITYPSMRSRPPMRHPETPIFVNYRMTDVAYSDGWQYYPESPVAMRHLGSAMTGYEQRLVQQHHFELGMASRTPMALNSPPRAQSGRGGLRLATASKPGLVGKIERSGRRSSFPISNRGKGRGSPGNRMQLLTDAALNSVTEKSTLDLPSTPEDSDEKLQKLGEEVGQRVAVAISKKTKRKLPLKGAASGEVSSQDNLESAHQKQNDKLQLLEENNVCEPNKDIIQQEDKDKHKDLTRHKVDVSLQKRDIRCNEKEKNRDKQQNLSPGGLGEDKQLCLPEDSKIITIKKEENEKETKAVEV